MSDEIDTVTDCDHIDVIVDDELEKGYREMAADREAEAEALEWCEALSVMNLGTNSLVLEELPQRRIG